MKKYDDIIKEVEVEYAAKAKSVGLEDLQTWSLEAHASLKAVEATIKNEKDRSKSLAKDRDNKRLQYKKVGGDPDAMAAWHKSCQLVKDNQATLKTLREEKKYAVALSTLLSKELGKRNGSVKASLSEAKDSSPPENCPFCEHEYTVRDGKGKRLKPDGSPVQFRKCQCREMAPPCKNCPSCKEDEELMQNDVKTQLQVCTCEICNCGCPGGGKWVEGDLDSREQYKVKAENRQSMLMSILNDVDDLSPTEDVELFEKFKKRLPSHIRDQLDLVFATRLLAKCESPSPAHSEDNGCIGCCSKS
jgi:hypothetical protein